MNNSTQSDADTNSVQNEQHLDRALSSDITGSSAKTWGFAVFMLALTLLFAFLGNWQVNRLAEKEAMLGAIEERIGNDPIFLPPLAEWIGFDPQTYNYRPLSVTGIFDHSKTVLVFTALVGANGTHSGPGYWVVAPLMLDQGGAIFVNRGFIPERLAGQFKEGGVGPVEEVTIIGTGRVSEKINSFTPGTDFQNRIEWVRNIERLSQFVDEDMGPFAPIYLDAAASSAGALPQGGETKLTIVNRHLEYAMTWYSLALLTPGLLFFWWRNNKKTKLAS